MDHGQVRVFFSYAHQDEKLAHQFMTHLAFLKRQREVDIWHNGEIKAGDIWETSISEELKAAQLILLFISPDYIASTYCYEIEMKQALERHKAGKARVIPIIARPTVGWNTSPFGELQVVPKNGKAVTTWTNRDEAWFDVVERIRETIQDLIGDTISIKQTRKVGTGKSGLTFVRIALEEKNKSWLDMTGRFTRGDALARGTEYEYAQHFRLTGDESYDPSFDITLLNPTTKPVILSDVGIEIATFIKYGHDDRGGIGRAKKVTMDTSYTIEMPDIKRITGLVLPKVVSTSIPDPIYVPSQAPYRYSLFLHNYIGRMEPYTILRMWLRTNQDQERSDEIYLEV